MLTQNSFLKILKQFRSTCGTLASRVREGLFSYFGESNLTRITTSDTPSEIAKWKNSTEVAQCYKKLFDNRNNVLAKILEKVFGKNLPPDVHSAYAIAICTTILNPKGEGIQLSEELMKKKFDCYLVSFIIFGYMTFYLLFINIIYLSIRKKSKIEKQFNPMMARIANNFFFFNFW
jgi:hypothetical protein